MKKILILDFDGTIIDSNFAKKSAIKNFIRKKYNIEISRIIDNYKFQSLTRYELISLVKNSPILDFEKSEIDTVVNKSVIESNFDQYFFDLFKFCTKNKIKIILVSNTPEKSLKEIINKLKIIDCFYKLIGKKDNNDKKKIFSEIIKNELVKPSEILSVGDSIDDYFASKVNQIPFHGIHNYSLLNLAKNIPLSSTLRGIIKSLK